MWRKRKVFLKLYIKDINFVVYFQVYKRKNVNYKEVVYDKKEKYKK